MSVSSTTDTAASSVSSVTNPKGILGKDDFLKLLLVELQHQDPTEPTDSEKILSQTSQLATLESAENTNAALEELAASLGSAQQFGTIAAIGKMADLGSDAISLDKGTSTSFEVYFPQEIAQGTLDITDVEGNVIKSLNVTANPAGIHQFTWDGSDSTGNAVESGVFHVNARYNNTSGEALTTKLGSYPIESVRFDGGEALVKVGSNYVPLDSIREVF